MLWLLTVNFFNVAAAVIKFKVDLFLLALALKLILISSVIRLAEKVAAVAKVFIIGIRINATVCTYPQHPVIPRIFLISSRLIFF